MAHIYIKLIEFCLLCFMVWKCAQMAALKVTLFASLLFCIMSLWAYWNHPYKAVLKGPWRSVGLVFIILNLHYRQTFSFVIFSFFFLHVMNVINLIANPEKLNCNLISDVSNVNVSYTRILFFVHLCFFTLFFFWGGGGCHVAIFLLRRGQQCTAHLK